MRIVDFVAAFLDEPELVSLSDRWRTAYCALLRERFEGFLEALTPEDPLRTAAIISDCQLLSQWISSPATAYALINFPRTSKDAYAAVKSGYVQACAMRDPDIFASVASSANLHLCVPLHGIPLDIAGAFAFAPNEPYYGVLSDPRSDEVVHKVDSALSFLKVSSPCSYLFVAQNTLFLSIRTDLSDADSFSSSSFSGYSGLTLLTNVHNPRIDAARVVDALYHEAIHAVIYFFEEVQHKLVSMRPPPDFRITSPWSDRPLTADQYAQACFVWLGLLQFWKKLEPAGGISDDRRTEMLKRAQRGFYEKPHKRLLARGGHRFIDQRTVEAIRQIELAVEH